MEPSALIWCPTTRAVAARAGWANYVKSRWTSVSQTRAVTEPPATIWWVRSAASVLQVLTVIFAKTTSTSVYRNHALPARHASTFWLHSSASARQGQSVALAIAVLNLTLCSTSPAPEGWITSPGRRDSASVNSTSSLSVSGCRPRIRFHSIHLFYKFSNFCIFQPKFRSRI